MKFRKVMALALAASMAVSLNAVSVLAEGGDTTDITLWTYPVGSWGDSAVVDQMISNFNEAHPEINVTVEYLDYTNGDDQINTAINLNPTHVFMAFGSNDLEIYGSDSSGFIDAYRTQIKKIQASLPDVPVYINCILPITDEAIAANPSLGYYSDYNDGLVNLCQELGCTFIDNTSIVENSSENLYEPDGEHVIQTYYPKWLTHMAQIAGLQA